MSSLYVDMLDVVLYLQRRMLTRFSAHSQALKSDGWNTEPFSLSEDKETGRFYGRGSSDDKGPILGWLNVCFERRSASAEFQAHLQFTLQVIEAHTKTNTEMPVNLKMVFEGMEESGSDGLEEVVVSESKKFLSNVDAVCIS